ncbi:MAG TPA: PPE domain-containing protein [Pseudonocardiaceae bacterium]
MGGENNSGYPQMCRNWMAVPHQQLYDDIHTGPGVDGTRTTQDTYARIGELFARVDGEISAGLARLGMGYEGDGSDAAQAGIAVLQQWTQDAQSGSSYAGDVVAFQAEGYATARDTMPEPVQVTAQNGFLDKIYDFFGGTTAREEQELQAREAHVRAAQVMSDYDLQSADAANAMPTFVPPPSVTVDVSPPQAQTASVQPTGATVTQTSGTGTSGGTGTQGAVSVGWGTGGPGGGPAGVRIPTMPSDTPAPTPGASAPTGPGGPGAPTVAGPVAPAPGGGVQPGTGGYRPGGAAAAGVPPGGYRPGVGGPGEYEHSRRPGLGTGRFGPGGFDQDGAGARNAAGRSGLGAEGFGARGSGGIGGGSGGTGISGGRVGFGAGGLAEEGGHAGRNPAATTHGTAGGFMQPAAPGSGDEDREHRRRYLVETDTYFADDRLVPPPVIGEHHQR